MSRVVCETERLVIRRLQPDDLGAMYAVYSDPLGARWVDDGEPITSEACERWVEVTQRNYEARGYGMFAMSDRATGAVVGFIGIVHPGGQEQPEIKYALAKSHWGRGLATEGVRAVLQYGATAHGIGRFIATVHPDNAASQRVLTKMGMRALPPIRNADGSTTLVCEWTAPSPDATR